MHLASLISADGISRVSDWFRWRLLSEAKKSELSADCIATIVSVESAGFQADIENPLHRPGQRGAAGLLQLMPPYAAKFGGTDAVLAMSAEAQLERIILPHFRRFSALQGNTDCGAYYLTVFMPAHYASPDDTVLGRQGDETAEPKSGLSRDRLYVQNYGFDAGAKRRADGTIDGGKGFYTVGDVKALIRGRAAAWANRPRIQIDLDKEPERPDTSGGAWAGLLLFLFGVTAAVIVSRQ